MGKEVLTIYSGGYIDGGFKLNVRDEGPEPLYPTGIEIDDDPTVYNDEDDPNLYPPEVEENWKKKQQRQGKRTIPRYDENDIEPLFPPGFCEECD